MEKKGKPKSRGNGQGTAILSKNKKSWIAIVTIGKKVVDGKFYTVRKKKSGFPTKKAALNYCPTLLAEGHVDKKARYTLQEVYDMWEPYYESRVGSSTMDNYKYAYKHFKDIHNIYIDTIEPEDLQECMDKCKSGKRTHQNMKCTAGLLWAYAVDHKIIDRDITRNLYIGKQESLQREPLTDEEVKIFKNEIGKTKYAEYIYCLCYLGFRPGELLELKKENLHETLIDDKKVYYFVAGKKTQAGRNRTVVIPSQILGIILERKDVQGTDLLFPQYVYSRNKSHEFIGFKQMSDEYLRDSVFKKIAMHYGINPKKVPYCTRHTYADKLDKAAGTDKSKAKLIGHSDYQFTQHKYQSTQIADLNEVAESIK